MTATLRITHVYKSYGLVEGGIENCVRSLAESEAAEGHVVDVISCGPRADMDVSGVRVRRFPALLTTSSMPISLELYRAVRSCTSDIICVHSPFPLGEAALCAVPHNVKVVAFHHSDVVRQKILLKVYAPFYRRFLERADIVIATSSEYISSSPWLKPHFAKCKVVPIGVDTSKFSYVEHERSNACLHALFVGKLRYYKGLDTLLRAMAMLPGTINLDIVGTGPMEMNLRRLAVRLGISGRIRFHGFLSDSELVKKYQMSDLFVLPCNCRAEAFGTVLVEAMACGLPCVTCEVGSGTSSVVRNGETGIVVPPRNSAAIASAIKTFADDPCMAQEFGFRGHRRAESLYDINEMCSRFMKAVTE